MNPKQFIIFDLEFWANTVLCSTNRMLLLFLPLHVTIEEEHSLGKVGLIREGKACSTE
jgi:hypothetical protein